MDDNRNNKRNEAPLIQGDANAISGLNYSVDSHDASNFNNTTNSNNVSNSNNTTTNNYFQQSKEERMAEAKEEYLKICKYKIKGGLISTQVRRELDEWGIKLSLPKDEMHLIEQSVKDTFSTKEMLSSVDQTTLNLVLKKVESNATNIKDVLPKMEALAQKVEQDEVQYWYYLLLAIENPSLCIKRYEDRKCDTYWQSYWVFMAYLRNGLVSKAVSILTELQEWEYSIDNLKLLQCAELLYTYYNGNGTEDEKETATGLLNDCYAVHSLLMDFRDSLEYLSNSVNRKITTSNSSLCNFYLRLFGLKLMTMNMGTKTDIQRINDKTNTFLNKEHLKAFSSEKPKTISDEAIGFIDNTLDDIKKTEPIQEPIPKEKEEMKKKEEEEEKKKKEEEKKKKLKNKLLIILTVIILFVIGKNLISNQSEDNNTEAIEAKQEITIQENETAKKESSSVKGGSVTGNKTSVSSGKTATTSKTTKKTTTKVEAQSEPAPTTVPTKQEAPKPVEMTAEDCIRKGIAAVRSFNDAKALDYFKKALEKGSNDAYLQIGHLYYNGGNDIEKNYPTAFSYYMKAAVAGYTEAQYMVGKMYRNGQGTNKDLNSAKVWLRKAASNGHVDAEKLLKSL